MEDFHISAPLGTAARLKATLESVQPLIAPVEAGNRVGTLKLTLDGKPWGEYPVVALETVRIANIFGRGLDTLRLMFK